MRYTHEVRLRLTGDREEAQRLIPYARTVLGGLIMRNEGTGKPLALIAHQVGPIRVGISDGVPWIHIHVAPKEGEEKGSTAEECHTGLFVQASAYGLLASGEFRDFFLAVNQLRLYESTVRTVQRRQAARIPLQPWRGPISLKRDQNETWTNAFGQYLYSDAFFRLSSRDDVCCFTQVDPTDPAVLWGGMSNGCGQSDPEKRFWVGMDAAGRRVFFHHNFIEVFAAGNASRDYVLSVRVAPGPAFDWDTGVALAAFEIPLPRLPWAETGNGYFFCDINATGTRVLLGGVLFIDYGVGHPARYIEQIVEVVFTLDETASASVSRLKWWAPTGTQSSINVHTFSSTNLGGEETEAFDLWIYRDASDPTGETAAYHSADVVVVPFGDPTPPVSALWLARVNNSYVGGFREVSSGIMGAYYRGNTNTVDYIRWHVDRTWTFDNDNDFITLEDIDLTGSILYTDCVFPGTCVGTGSITATVPERTFTGRVSTDISITAGTHTVASFGYNEVRSVVMGEQTLTWTPEPDSNLIRKVAGPRPISNTQTVSTTSPPSSFFPVRDAIPPLVILQPGGELVRVVASNLNGLGVANVPPFIPDYFDNEMAYIPTDSWGWLSAYTRTAPFDRLSFMDFHGGCKQFSICEFQAPVTGDPHLPMTVYRSQVVTLGRDDNSIQYRGNPTMYFVGPNYYRVNISDIGSVYGVDAQWKITPQYEMRDKAIFNPITGQLAYGFNHPIAWQGEWRGWPWENCDGAPTSYAPLPDIEPNPPFGVAKLLDPVYIPEDAPAGWVGTPLPNDDSPGCPE